MSSLLDHLEQPSGICLELVVFSFHVALCVAAVRTRCKFFPLPPHRRVPMLHSSSSYSSLWIITDAPRKCCSICLFKCALLSSYRCFKLPTAIEVTNGLLLLLLLLLLFCVFNRWCGDWIFRNVHVQVDWAELSWVRDHRTRLTLTAD